MRNLNSHILVNQNYFHNLKIYSLLLTYVTEFTSFRTGYSEHMAILNLV